MTTLGFVGMGTGDFEPFDMVFDNGSRVNGAAIKSGAPIDALVIWGGEDISPSLYNEPVSRMTGAGKELSFRDKVEVEACKEAIARGIPLIGVCRGAQLLCALAGGRLIQHVENHCYSHFIDTFDGESVVTSSCHHQMMVPFGVDHKLIAWAQKRISPFYINGNDEDDEFMHDKPEPEIVWFPKIKGLAIQGHPEFHADPENDPFVKYCMEKVKQFILAQ